MATKEHQSIKMAGRMEELSQKKFSSKNLSQSEKTEEFIKYIAEEWIIKDRWENPDGITCVCGHSVKAGAYYKCYNVQNGNVVKLSYHCMKHIKDRVLHEKEYKKSISRKLTGYKTKAFKTMSEYVREVVYSIIQEWTLDFCIRYLKVYQDNEIIRGLIIDEITIKNRKRSDDTGKKIQKLKEVKAYECMERSKYQAELKLSQLENKKLKEELKEYKKKEEFNNLFNNHDRDDSDSDSEDDDEKLNVEEVMVDGKMLYYCPKNNNYYCAKEETLIKYQFVNDGEDEYKWDFKNMLWDKCGNIIKTTWAIRKGIVSFKDRHDGEFESDLQHYINGSEVYISKYIGFE